ncbi:MAG TPA: hypothetical protein VGL80_10480 [Pseudonocardiaceae bacterium]
MEQLDRQQTAHQQRGHNGPEDIRLRLVHLKQRDQTTGAEDNGERGAREIPGNAWLPVCAGQIAGFLVGVLPNG